METKPKRVTIIKTLLISPHQPYFLISIKLPSMISLICGIYKMGTNELIYKTEIELQM